MLCWWGLGNLWINWRKKTTPGTVQTDDTRGLWAAWEPKVGVWGQGPEGCWQRVGQKSSQYSAMVRDLSFYGSILRTETSSSVGKKTNFWKLSKFNLCNYFKWCLLLPPLCKKRTRVQRFPSILPTQNHANQHRTSSSHPTTCAHLTASCCTREYRKHVFQLKTITRVTWSRPCSP